MAATKQETDQDDYPVLEEADGEAVTDFVAPKLPPEKAPAGVTDFEGFLGADARERVPMAGLLAARPELRETWLTPGDWQQELDKYMTSERV